MGGLSRGFSAGSDLCQASALFKITFLSGYIIDSSSESHTTAIILASQLS